ncbi:MAG TPA: hypothetical protein VHI52_11265, partial [Verrucomicrobiae bacterium]|nr:hypothetical protein [Verrucomicrobiae bacterium]
MEPDLERPNQADSFLCYGSFINPLAARGMEGETNFEPGDQEMSARMETEAMNWQGRELMEPDGRDLTAIQLECLIRNSDNRNLVAPLREVQAALGEAERAELATHDKRKAALALQEQWNRWFEQREQLRNEIKRGRECLEQVQKDVAL